MVARSRNALSSALSVAVPDSDLESQTVLKVGFLAPLTGKVRSWAEAWLERLPPLERSRECCRRG